MPNLDFINTLNPSSIGSAIEVTVASIASPTELNGRAAAQGDLVLARTTEAGTGSQTLYYADTTSDAESLPYIVSSATAGVKFIACGGRYNNGSKAIGGLTASRLLRTDASKNLESNAALTNTYVLYADSNGWPTGSSGFITTGSAAAIGAGTPSPTSVFLVYANDANVSNTQGLTIRQASTGDAVLQLSNPSFRFAWGLDSSTGLMKMCNASGLSDLLGDDTRTLLQFDQSTSILTLCSSTLGSLNVRQAATFSVSSGAGITVSSTTDSTSKDTGSIVTEGGIGVEKAVNVGTTLSIGTSFTETATQAPFRMEQTLTDTQCGGMSVRPTYTPAAGNANQSRALGVTWTVNASAGDLTASLPNAVVRAVTSVTGGNITALAGLTSFLNHTGSGTITNWYGLNVQTPVNSGGGTITNNYAIKIFSPSAGTNRLGLDIDNVSGGSVNYAIRTGTGLVSIGDTTDSTSKDTGSIVTEGGIGVEKSLYAGNSILSVGATNGIGYATGAGGTVTQITSRTTGVTLNKVCGEITLVSAAGSATWQSFTVTNSAMAATDNVVVNQKSGTDLYMIHVTAKAAGSFRISFATTGGTTSEQPVFGFSIIKSVAA